MYSRTCKDENPIQLYISLQPIYFPLLRNYQHNHNYYHTKD